MIIDHEFEVYMRRFSDAQLKEFQKLLIEENFLGGVMAACSLIIMDRRDPAQIGTEAGERQLEVINKLKKFQ